MKHTELICLLKAHGWTKARQTGSHAVFIKPGQRSIVVPIHAGKDVPTGTLHAILKQAGLKGI